MSRDKYVLSDFQRYVMDDFFILKLLIVICSLVVVTAAAICIIHVDTVCKQQIDTLDQLNYIRQAVEPEEVETAAGESFPPIALTLDERALAERVVMSEAGSGGMEMQMAVAQTLSDRMNDFGITLQEAVIEGVYSTADNGEPTESVKIAVSNVFDHGAVVFNGSTYQFHDTSFMPSWTVGKIDRGQIGNMRFYGGWLED